MRRNNIVDDAGAKATLKWQLQTIVIHSIGL